MGGALRYGIIGTGMMGCEHIRNLALVDGVQIVAIADPHAPSRDAGRRALGRDVAEHADHRDLLARRDLDAVVIASPNHTHYDVLQDVFRTRLHVLVEKPLCTTVADCRRVVEAAARHPGVVWVGMEYRYMPAVDRLLAEVSAGAAGRLRMIAIREHRFPFLHKVGDWNRFNRNTGGTLVEKCCHFFDLMTLVAADRPVRVYASGACDVNHRDERYGGEAPDILDNAFVIVDFARGLRASLDLCMFAENSRDEMELVATGDAGKVEAYVPSQTLVVRRRDRRDARSERFAIDPAAAAAGFHHGSTLVEHQRFAAAIRGGAGPEVSVRDGALAVALGAAGEISARERRPVELAELGF
jgi:predicted dehydrogenase